VQDRINELAMNSKNKNIRDLYRRINKFKRVYQHRSNLVKDENGDLLADSNKQTNSVALSPRAIYKTKNKTNSVALSPRTNYTD
jgi:hypothetical protein